MVLELPLNHMYGAIDFFSQARVTPMKCAIERAMYKLSNGITGNGRLDIVLTLFQVS